MDGVASLFADYGSSSDDETTENHAPQESTSSRRSYANHSEHDIEKHSVATECRDFGTSMSNDDEEALKRKEEEVVKRMAKDVRAMFREPKFMKQAEARINANAGEAFPDEGTSDDEDPEVH